MWSGETEERCDGKGVGRIRRGSNQMGRGGEKVRCIEEGRGRERGGEKTDKEQEEGGGNVA